MCDVVHKEMMIDQKKTDLKETAEKVDEATETLDEENPAEIGPGITERYEDT